MKVSCLSAFDDKSIMPDDNMVAVVLGNTASIWDEPNRGTVHNVIKLVAQKEQVQGDGSKKSKKKWKQITENPQESAVAKKWHSKQADSEICKKS